MNPSPLERLGSMVADVPALIQKLNQCVKNWEPENPPVTVAFGEVGDAIAENWADISAESKSKIFEQIEQCITSEDSALATAMATGLIEALVTKSDQEPELWPMLEKLFGSQSLRHALAWKNFGSKET